MRTFKTLAITFFAVSTVFAGCNGDDGAANNGTDNGDGDGDGDSNAMGGAGGNGDGDLYGDGDGDGDGDGSGGTTFEPPPLGGNPGMGGTPSTTVDYSDRVYTFEECESSAPAGMGGASACTGATITVVDAYTDRSPRSCRAIEDGSELAVMITGDAPLTIQADFCDERVISANFTIDGELTGTHNVAPFAIAPDTDGDFDANDLLVPGEYEIKVNGYELADGLGEPVQTATIRLVIIDTSAGAGGAAP